MAKVHHPVIQMTDGEGSMVHATWSRSGNLIVTVARDEQWRSYEQVVLTPDQVERVSQFLAAGPHA